MTIADRAVLVTGANRGIGQALVEEALRRGATAGVCRYAPTVGPLGWAGHAADPGRDRRGADPGGGRAASGRSTS